MQAGDNERQDRKGKLGGLRGTLWTWAGVRRAGSSDKKRAWDGWGFPGASGARLGQTGGLVPGPGREGCRRAVLQGPGGGPVLVVWGCGGVSQSCSWVCGWKSVKTLHFRKPK